MTERRMLTKEVSTKDTQHYVIDISGSDLIYTCGDSLGVYPTNRIEDVDAILKALWLSGEEKVCMKNDPEDISLRDALFRRVALALPTKKFLITLSEKVSEEEEKKKLEELLSEDSKEATKAYLMNREFIDLLEMKMRILLWLVLEQELLLFALFFKNVSTAGVTVEAGCFSAINMKPPIISTVRNLMNI
jgi:sulfite reductase (NADPH) flavoprotein alpha-component